MAVMSYRKRVDPKRPGGRAARDRGAAPWHASPLLADQKMNDGIPVPFFGRPAMTARLSRF
jgi:hypothetical protein